MKNIEDLETYINRNGYPILRRCKNCVFWNEDTEFHKKHKAGYCRRVPLYFAFTLEPSVYPITKEFFLCEEHQLEEENRLSEICDKMLLKDALKKKEEL